MNQVNLLYEKISLFKKKLLLSLLLKSSVFFVTIFISIFLIVNYIEYFLYLSATTKTALVFILITGFIYLLIKQIIIPLKSFIQFDKSIPDDIAAKTIGNEFPEIEDRLLNTIQLKNTGNQELVIESLNQRAFSLVNYDFNIAVNKQEVNKYRYLYIIPFIILIITLLYNTNILFEGSQRLLDFNKTYQPPMPFQISLGNSSLNAFKNEPFDIKFTIDGDVAPQNVYLNIDGVKRKGVTNDEKNYVYSISNLSEPKEFTIEASGFKTKAYKINLIHRPSIQKSIITVRPPDYINQKATRINSLSSLTVPEGSTVNWIIETQHSNKLIFTIDTSTSHSQNPQSFTIEKTIKHNTNYNVSLKNKYSTNRDSLSYNIKVIKDQQPKISLNSFKDTSLYSYILLDGQIDDDYGFSNLYIKYSVNHADYQYIKIPINKNQPSQNYSYYWNIDTLHLSNKDELKYYLEIWDNDGVNGAKMSRSSINQFRIPDRAAAQEKVNKESEKVEENFEKTIEQMKNEDNRLEELEKKLKSKKKLSWQDRKNLEDEIKKQQKLKEELENLKKNFSEVNKMKNKLSNPSEKLKEKTKKLEQLMNEMLDEETKKLYEELQKLLNENKPNDEEIKKALEELNKNDQNLEKELDRMLDLMKELKLQMKTEELSNKLEELAKKEKELSDKTLNKDADNEKLKESQSEIQKEFQELKKDMGELDKLNKELNNEDNKFDKETSEEQKSIEEEMKNSSEQLQKNNNKKAGDSQKKASEEMQKMSDKLSEMMMDGDMDQMEEDLNTIRGILENLVKISFDQEKLMDQFKNIKKVNPQFVEHSTAQIKIKDDSKIIEDSLLALASRNFQIESFITDELFEMNDKIDKSLEAIRDRKTRNITVNQHLAMTSMNNLALLLSDVAEQMQQQMAQQMPGNQTCNKPNGKKPGQKLSMIQKNLNKKIAQLKKSGLQGQKLSEELAKLAAEQEALRQALKEEESKNGNKPGDSGKLEKLMEETEKDLVNKRLLDKTLMRQEEILSRLLKHEKAMRERELDEKREAEQAKQHERNIPKEFEEYLKEKEKQVQLLKTVSPQYSPYYKKEIKEYFESETK